jgi:putative sterol carrier protein
MYCHLLHKMFYYALLINKWRKNMADVASILAQFEAGIAGKDTGLGATVKFDFEGEGCIFLDGKSNPNTVSGEDQDADCTLTMSVETFEKMSSGELDGTSAFMQGQLKVDGDMSVAMKLSSVMDALK